MATKTKRIDPDPVAALGSDEQIQVIDERRHGFVIIYNDVIKRYTPIIGYAALAVYVNLAVHGRGATERDAYPSIRKQAKRLRMEEPTVRKAISRLVKAGLITVTPRTTKTGDGKIRHTSHLYRILDLWGPSDDPDSGPETGAKTPRKTGRRGVVQKVTQNGAKPPAAVPSQGPKALQNKPAEPVGGVVQIATQGWSKLPPQTIPSSNNTQQQAAAAKPDTGAGGAAAAEKEKAGPVLDALKAHGIDRTARARALAARVSQNGHLPGEIAAVIASLAGGMTGAIRSGPALLLSKLDDMTPADWHTEVERIRAKVAAPTTRIVAIED